MSGPNFSLHSTFRPTEGSGTIRLTFPDLRKSTRKNADALVESQIAKIAKDHPGTVVSAQLKEGSRFASSWTYELSAVKPVKPATPASPAPATTN